MQIPRNHDNCDDEIISPVLGKYKSLKQEDSNKQEPKQSNESQTIQMTRNDDSGTHMPDHRELVALNMADNSEQQH